MVRSLPPAEDGLAHVIVCGGTPGEWSSMSTDDWSDRFASITRGVAAVGARWVTLFPHHGAEGERAGIGPALGNVPGLVQAASRGALRWQWTRGNGPTVIIDPDADGHRRFASVVETLSRDTPGFGEEELSLALSAPAPDHADLVLILGPPDVLPTSLVWELAYSELVFLDISWAELKPVHLEMAIDDFNRRHRRFGGLDS